MDYCPQENFDVLAAAIQRIEQYLGLNSDTGNTTISGRVYQLENPFSTANITPTSTVDVDSVPITVDSVKWIIDYETTDNLRRTVEVLGMDRNGTPIYSTYGILGDYINESTSVVISGSNLVLRIQNNHTASMNVKAYRLKAK